jgi:hypothetical protein
MQAKLGYVLRAMNMASGELGSSVSIVFGYGLDDRAIGIRYSAEAKGVLL